MKRFFPYDVFGQLASLNIKMAEKERKIQPTAVPHDTLPERHAPPTVQVDMIYMNMSKALDKVNHGCLLQKFH